LSCSKTVLGHPSTNAFLFFVIGKETVDVLCDRLRKGVTRKLFCVAASSWMDTIMLETTKSGITDSIKMKKHFFADRHGLKLIGTPGTSASLSSDAIVAGEGLNVC